MPVIRDLPLAASLLLVGLALFVGGGGEDGSLWWLGGGAAVAVVVLAAARHPLGAGSRAARTPPPGSRPRSRGRGCPTAPGTTRPRARLPAVCAARALALASEMDAPARDRARRAARRGGLLGAAREGAATRVRLRIAGVARLRGPVGLWNQLALLGDFALPLALWRKRLPGTLLAFVWLVALVLTYSRGGLATAVVVVAAFLVLTDDRWESAATLVAAVVPAALVVGIAFALPGVTSDGQSNATRWRDGLFSVPSFSSAPASPQPFRARRARATHRRSDAPSSAWASSRSRRSSPSAC